MNSCGFVRNCTRDYHVKACFDTSDYVMQIIGEYGMKELMPLS